MKRFFHTGIIVILLLRITELHAQPCELITPVFTVDLSGAPDSNWYSPSIQRDGYCCSAAGSDVCIEFILTLDSAAVGISFNIASGAVPPGALYYQVNCGVPVPVGQQLCLSGAGPHLITFCKPGNNKNSFSITSIPETNLQIGVTSLSSPLCPGIISIHGLDEASITCSAIPSNASYDGFLNCPTGCDSISITPSGSFPLFVDYVVCGNPFGGCGSGIICDTVRVYLSTDVSVNISPPGATLCNGINTTLLTANASGGTSHFQYLWSTGQNTTSIVAGAGTYSVTVTDSALCATTTDVVTITVPPPIVANAGADLVLCGNTASVSLSGSVQTATGGMWIGGAGSFSPSNTSLNASYTPTAAERTAGFINLVLQTTGNQGCPPDYDTVHIYLPPQSVVTLSLPNTLLCNGVNTTPLSANVSGGIAPYQYLWNNGQATQTIVAGAGTFSVTVTDSFLCTSVSNSVIITVRPPIVANAGADNTICTNVSSVNLNGSVQTATGGLWSGGGGSFSPSNTTLNASYMPTATERIAGFVNLVLTTTGNLGCPGVTDTVHIFLPPPSVVTLSLPNTILCNGVNTTPLSVNVSGGIAPYQYLWNNGQTTQAIVAGAGTFSVTVTDSFLCTSVSNSATITVRPPLVANAGADNTICTNVTSVNLNGSVQTATGGIWSGGGGSFSPSNTSLNTSYTPTATERLAGFVNLVLTTTGNQGCPAVTDTVRINLPSAILVTLSQPSMVLCNGSSSINLSASATGGIPPYQYQWNNGQITQSIVVATGTYAVTVTDAAMCSGVSTAVTITIQPPIVANAGAPVTICSNVPSVSLSGSVQNASGGIWRGGSGSFDPENTALSVTYTPTLAERNAGFVDLVLETTGNGGCPPAFDTVRITLAPMPSPSVTGSVILCANSVTNYSVQPATGNTYYWSANGGIINGAYNSNIANVTWSNSGTGSIVITQTNTFGCAASQTLNVTMVLLPTPVIDGNNILCQYSNQTYSVTANPGSTYEWIVSGGTVSGSSNSTSINITWNSNGTGSVSIVETNSFGCQQNFVMPVTIRERPVPVIAGNNSGCVNSTLTYSTAVLPNTNYFWNVTGGSIVSYNGANSINVRWNTNGSNNVSLTAMNTLTGCDSTVVLSVTVADIAIPVVQAPVLSGCPPLTISFAGNNPLPGQTYAWSFGDALFSSSANPTHIYTGSGTFNLMLVTQNGSGCVDTVTATVNVYEVPIASFTHNFESGNYYVDEDSLILSNTSFGASHYLWTFGTSDTANVFEPPYSYHTPGDYVLKLFAYNDQGCVDKALSLIRVRVRENIFVPNAFSPNADNTNDYFSVEAENITTFKISIFNRWGRMIYSSDDKDFKWDGTFHGDQVPLGIYVYQVTAKGDNGNDYKLHGTVSLVR